MNTQVIDFFEVSTMILPGSEEDRQPTKTLENELGSFQTTFIHETDLLKIREYSYSYFENQTIAFKHERTKYVEISFFLHDKPLHDEVDETKNTYLPYTAYVYFTPENADISVHYEKNIRYRNMDIYVPLSFFKAWAQQHPGVDRFLQDIEENQYGHLFPTGIAICPKIAATLNELRSCSLTGIGRDMHIRCKILELLGMFFQAKEEDARPQEDSLTIQLTARDIAVLKEIKQLLMQYPERFLTIAYLSKKFNINDFKLKKGFKKLFHKGIFEFTNAVRMNRGLTLLQEADSSVKEIAYQLGYSSPSAFTVAFKRQYGLPPNRFKPKTAEQAS